MKRDGGINSTEKGKMGLKGKKWRIIQGYLSPREYFINIFKK
jgi:hypothetical protein